MFRVLTLSTLFPDASRPTFGPFVERQTLALAARAGVEVQVVAPVGLPPVPLAPYAALRGLKRREDWKGLTVHRPRFLHVPGLGRLDPSNLDRALRPVLSELRHDFPFDVIDASFFWPDGPAAVALGRHFGVPVSIKARGADIHYWGGRYPALVARAGCNAQGLLAVSEALKHDMIALGMPADRITVHHTGIDREIFRVRDRAAAKAALGIVGPLVVCVGALISRKGQALVLDALTSLPGVTLVLIGKGADEGTLRAQAERLGLSARVRFTGAIAANDIADWLAAADVMALPSSSEGLANAWVEALASGTPVVTCDVGGAREVIDRPEAGRLVPREPQALASAIADLLASPPDREAVAATVEKFSWEANAAALEAHLRGLR